MKKSAGSELWHKMVHSGSRLNFFLGVNIIVFLAAGLIRAFEFIFSRSTLFADLLILNLAMPAYLPALAGKFWTPLTYMFAHQELFHFLFNMLWLYWLGRMAEGYLNKQQFTFVYLSGGLSGALLFIISYNLLPAFANSVSGSAPLLGASASVMAVVVATATLLPDFSLRLLFFGDVKLKYLAIVYVLLDIIGIAGLNPGGSIAHLGGALLGFAFIKSLRAGNDWSKIFSRQPRLKIIRNAPASSVRLQETDQEIIDRILDKISQSGYDSLSRKEKEQLFKASKKE